MCRAYRIHQSRTEELLDSRASILPSVDERTRADQATDMVFGPTDSTVRLAHFMLFSWSSSFSCLPGWHLSQHVNPLNQ